MRRANVAVPVLHAALATAVGLASCKTGTDNATATSATSGSTGGGSGTATSASSSGSSGAGGAMVGDGSADGGDAGSPAPPLAAAAGYLVNTFTSTLAQSRVDVANTQKTGFQWYLGQFFGSPTTPAPDLTFNADGTLTLDGAGTEYNAGINTATPSTNAAGWVGVAF